MFKDLKLKLRENFDSLSSQVLFYVNIDREVIWNLYLEGFSDPLERQEHNCNACKSFLRQWGGIVAIDSEYKIISIWDGIEVPGFETSIHNIRRYIHSRPITDVFYNEFASIGTDHNHDSVRNVEWEHFHLTLPSKFVLKRNIDTIRAEKRTTHDVFKRALDEISIDAVETVIDLIGQGSLYRGNEYLATLSVFRTFQKQYAEVPSELKDNYAWFNSTTAPGNITHVRNTSIGTLLIDLSKGVDLDTAVSSFERVLAPTNYKRPKALVTPKMVEEAKQKLQELGLMNSLERRFANETDLSVENVIFTDKSTSVTDVFKDITKDQVVNPKSLSKVEEISIEDFIKNVVPTAKTIELLLENRHMPNMVSLITAQDKEAPGMFKWNNPFSWSYTGGITDSIKERVKAAGGNVTGEIRVSLSWHNYDDLDLHAIEPGASNNHICFNTYRGHKSPGQGMLDVDMNAGRGHTREPVENIVWDGPRVKEGTYEVWVHQFSRREVGRGEGFTIQIEAHGEVFEFSEQNNPTGRSNPIKFKYSKTNGITFEKEVKSNTSSKDVWNLKTNTFVRVKKFMLSPNYWNGSPTGNKHFFFFLEGAKSTEDPRPFFNEFLQDKFNENRKVFEVLGSKLRIEASPNQLSGVGFSETQRNSAIVRVGGTFQRTLKINF